MNDGGPAMPVDCYWENGAPVKGVQTSNATGYCTGLTVRDEFAIGALGHIPALLAAKELNKSIEAIATWAYKVADALLIARENQPGLTDHEFPEGFWTARESKPQ